MSAIFFVKQQAFFKTLRIVLVLFVFTEKFLRKAIYYITEKLSRIGQQSH